jgi:hypothetical protein
MNRHRSPFPALPTRKNSTTSFASSTRPARSIATFDTTLVELVFVFLPDYDAAELDYNPPHPRGRPGTALHFWRAVKDVLRNLTFHGYRGSYKAPGNGRRNNIVRQPLPQGAGNPPLRHGGSVAHIPGHRPHLDVLPLPPTNLPVALTPLPMPQSPHHSVPSPPRHPAVAARPPLVFRGEKIKIQSPFRYSQEVLFEGNSDRFANETAAWRAMQDVVDLMHKHPTVHVTILGNAASDATRDGLLAVAERRY